MVVDGSVPASSLAPKSAPVSADTLFALGRVAWPRIHLDFELFENYFAPHRAAGRPVSEAHAADMVLACACAYGVEGGLAAVEHILRAEVARAVASFDPSPAFIDETLQATRERLLVRKGTGPARIGEYAGRASLQSWLCAIAVRWAISQRRRKGEQPYESLERAENRLLARGGPETEYLSKRYKQAFEAGVRIAIAALPAKDRMLLRLNVAEGMSVDKLAKIYRVGRSTAGRWLASARESLFERARREVCKTLGVTSSELDSLVVDLRSQLEISVLRLLERGEIEAG